MSETVAIAAVFLSLTGTRYAMQVGFHPIGEIGDNVGDLAPERGEAILNMWRDDIIGFANNKAVRFERLQILGQHALANAADVPAQLTESVLLFAQRDQDQAAPTA